MVYLSHPYLVIALATPSGYPPCPTRANGRLQAHSRDTEPRDSEAGTVGAGRGRQEAASQWAAQRTSAWGFGQKNASRFCTRRLFGSFTTFATTDLLWGL